MRLVVCSDAHLDWITVGVKRFEENSAAMRHTADVAIRSRADAWMFLGDLTDPDSGTCVFRCVQTLIEVVGKVTRAGIPAIVIAGNHDVIEDGSGDTSLSPLTACGFEDCYVVERPRVVLLDDVSVCCLPYAATSHAYGTITEASTMLDAAIMRAEATEYLPTGALPIVVVGHLSIDGIIPGEETREMGRGREVLFPYEVVEQRLKGRRSALLNGHYHQRQAFTPKGGSMPIQIPGSLARLAFGEQDNTPGYLVVEV